MTGQVQLSRPDEILDHTLRLLFLREEPVEPARLARLLGRDGRSLDRDLADRERRGRIRRDGRGAIVASSGLSLVESDYRIEVAGRRRWCWCAKTGLGILAALAAGGTLTRPAERLTVHFDGGTPRPTPYRVFWPADSFASGCSSAVDELCLTYVLVADAAAADHWVAGREVTGEVLTVEEAAARGASRYRHSLGLPDTRAQLLAPPEPRR